MSGKDEIRRVMRALRRTLSGEAQEAALRAVFAHVLGFAPYRQAESVMVYCASRGELSLAPVMEHALESGKALLLPRCEAPGVMTARRVTALSQLTAGAYGLMEPDASCEMAAPQEIDLIFVPGTAFDRAGGRIGQGGGYYDRFLEKTDALRVGICHDFALLDAVPVEKHDVPMHAVIAPQGVVMMDKGRRA